MLDSVSDYSKDGSAVAKENQWLTSKRGNLVQRKTKFGWKLLFKWKYGSKSWISLKLAKESNSIEVAEFITSRKIAYESLPNRKCKMGGCEHHYLSMT